MTSSIGGTGSFPIPPIQPDQLQNVPALAKDMQTQVQDLADSFSKLTADNSQARNSQFLQHVSTIVSALKQTVDKALNLRKL